MAIQNRYEFMYYVACTNCNPNGDPDMGNTPRIDPQTMQGYLTDVSTKRRIRNYVETCLEIPWSKKTKDRVDIDAARKILDADHDGLKKIKERILEYLAVKQLNPELKNQIICFVGPPGVGKTSLGASIARAMKRKYVRVSLGGIRDESDIRGHRKTYIGSMPGRIITALTQCGSLNPVMLLDEVD